MIARTNFLRGVPLVLIPSLWLIAIGVWLLAPAAVSAPAYAKHVILLSLDGTRADALKAVLPRSMTTRAALSWTAQTISPSLTLPAHASMLSGQPPSQHGVVFNDWREGEPHFSQRTVFTEVTQAGGSAAAIVHKSKLLMFMPAGSVARAQFLPYPRFRQADVAAFAGRYFLEQRPTLLFVHVADPDDAGHRYGWMSAEYWQVIGALPALIEGFLRRFEEAGLAGQWLLVVTADHGGHDRTHGTNRREDMTIPWLVFGTRARAGATIDRPVLSQDTAATILSVLGIPVPTNWQGRTVREAFE
ncbi:MAG: alkaline phosphatase family protein [bacterium]